MMRAVVTDPPNGACCDFTSLETLQGFLMLLTNSLLTAADTVSYRFRKVGERRDITALVAETHFLLICQCCGCGGKMVVTIKQARLVDDMWIKRVTVSWTRENERLRGVVMW
jgi:hypothetical protein